MLAVPTVLIVDDEDSICIAFQRFFSKRGWNVLTAASAEAGLQTFRSAAPSVVFLDVRLPDRNGLELVAELAAGNAAIVVITAFGGLETVVRAFQGRAYDYLVKPIDLDRAYAIAERVRKQRGEAAQPRGAESPAGGETLVGSSAAMQEVYKRIARVADSAAPVLIEGPTGTGKELVARAIHACGPRKAAPFVAINCGAIPEALIESELFGHVRGAFTGAESDRPGRIEAAADGTLLLDEIGDLPAAMQVKLLRFLDSGTIERIGSGATRPANARIIAATNKDLVSEVAQGRFRSDLYYRLAVLRISLPPLRERAADIPQLVEHFLRLAYQTPHPPAISPQALEMLLRHDWPGNVRELKSAILHAVAVRPGDTVLVEDLPPLVAREPGSPPPSNETLDRAVVEYAAHRDRPEGDRWHHSIAAVERALIRHALARTNGNQSEAAEYLGVHRNTLRNKLRELKISPEEGFT